MTTESRRWTFPVRYVFLVMAFLGFNILYSLRVNLSVAIVTMSKEVTNSSEVVVKTECYDPDAKSFDKMEKMLHLYPLQGNDTQLTTGEFDWNAKVQSYIVGSFFVGYVITQIPAGRLAERYGSKRPLAASILLASIFTLLCPIAARFHYLAFMGCRVLIGLSEGMFFPSMHSMCARWFPKSDRSFMTAIIYSGAQIGTMITMVATGYLDDSGLFGGWPSAFYVFGSIGLIWFVLWTLLIYESPLEHPYISEAEILYIGTTQNGEKSRKSGNTPWLKIVTSPAVWALVAAHFGQNWGFYTLLFELPNYLKTILGLDIKENGLISGLPYLIQAIAGWFAGYVFDVMIKSNVISINCARKIANTVGLVGPAICLVGLTVAKCHFNYIVGALFLAMAFNGFTYSGFNITHVDMSPDYAGTLMGITNCIANFAGVLAPLYVGVMTSKEVSLESWSWVFYTSTIVYSVTSIIFVLFGSAELQPWGLAKSNRKTSEP
ncbi:putative inorganic phosphate cotransporter isoform X2 [Panonychus citri]|uniref:putative inorganic phosphate cotransporter isoform X2 n=1 Tax=Panonychus citri TaxID=50023 RepID=UPI002307E033|nr:putative inorganic phosphate cotransporter isoform X2 [Panonychus citri]